MNLTRLVLGIVLGGFAMAAPLRGQATEAEIAARLKGRPLYLRGLWSADDLSFDAAGKLLSKSGTDSFTLSGFEFRHARLKRDGLVLEGARTAVEFTKDVPKRVGEGSDVYVRIALPSNGEFGPALDAVFADGLSSLVPALPSYWQGFARCHLAEPASAADCSLVTKATREGQIDKSMVLPRLTRQGEARFNAVAMQLKYSGTSTVHLIVGRDGVPSSLMVLHPAGVGLDEQALLAVAEYRFSPAMKDGKAVEVEVDVVVNLQMLPGSVSVIR